MRGTLPFRKMQWPRSTESYLCLRSSFMEGLFTVFPFYFLTLPYAGSQSKQLKEDILPRSHRPVKSIFQAGLGWGGKDGSTIRVGATHTVISSRLLQQTTARLASVLYRLCSGTAERGDRKITITSNGLKFFRRGGFRLRSALILSR